MCIFSILRFIETNKIWGTWQPITQACECEYTNSLVNPHKWQTKYTQQAVKTQEAFFYYST